MNFITAHDGFTLEDLVSYNEKHNEANGEDNRDGHDDNSSWNCGAEGQTDDPEILALRAPQKRNFLATLFLSQGVPMLLAGDEFGNSPGRQQQRLLPGQRDRLAELGESPRSADHRLRRPGWSRLRLKPQRRVAGRNSLPARAMPWAIATSSGSHRMERP